MNLEFFVERFVMPALIITLGLSAIVGVVSGILAVFALARASTETFGFLTTTTTGAIVAFIVALWLLTVVAPPPDQ